MVKRKLLAMLMAAAVFFTVGISSSMNVQATENDESVAPVTTFENFEKEEIEIPTVEVPEITYNAEGNKKCEQTFFFEGIQTLDTNDEEDNTDPNNAVEILNGEKKTNSLITDEFRWYHFTIQQLSKLTIYLEMDDTIDADLYLPYHKRRRILQLYLLILAQYYVYIRYNLLLPNNCHPYLKQQNNEFLHLMRIDYP